MYKITHSAQRMEEKVFFFLSPTGMQIYPMKLNVRLKGQSNKYIFRATQRSTMITATRKGGKDL